MAHSNRAKKKASRGGKTRNQEFKAKRTSAQQERLRNVIKWEEDRETKKEVTLVIKKVGKPNMSKSVVERRNTALKALIKQLEVGAKPLSGKFLRSLSTEDYLTAIKDNVEIGKLTLTDQERIRKEIDILYSRGATTK